VQICVLNAFLLINGSGQRLGPFGGVAFGVALVVAFGVALVVAFGVALVVAFGVAFGGGADGDAEGVAFGVAFGGGADGDAEGVEVSVALGFSGAGALLSVTGGLTGAKPFSDFTFTGVSSTFAKADLIVTPFSAVKLKASEGFSTFGTKIPVTSVILTTFPLLSSPMPCLIAVTVNVYVSDFEIVGLTNIVEVLLVTLLVD
jgi:hypothetical protein